MEKGLMWHQDAATLEQARRERAEVLAAHGGVLEALGAGALDSSIDVTLSEALVLGLLAQDVRSFLTVFGHGSTEIGEVLRIYADAGVVKVYPVRSEIEASHAAAALRWVTGEKAAVVTSIGPGALQAMAASLMPASNGLGVWYLLGDETSQDEGYNMQQIPKPEQGLFHRLFQTMSEAYSLHTPEALGTALRRGHLAVDHPGRGKPFYLLMPMNTQHAALPGFNVREILPNAIPSPGASPDLERTNEAVEAIQSSQRIVIRAGGGARGAGEQLLRLADLVDGVVVTSPVVSGVIPYHHPRNMSVGGSKGSICGNFAMEEADLLIVVGSRSVCQSDSSRTAYPGAKRVIHINSDLADAMHYNDTIALVGDAAKTLERLNDLLDEGTGEFGPSTVIDEVQEDSPWLQACRKRKEEWDDFKRVRYNQETLFDEKFGRELLTQPAAIHAAVTWARAGKVVSFFDAGDVQANGFQIVEDDSPLTFTDTGASYMGFAVSALLSTAVAKEPFYGLAFTGDGSFMMNPQILIDGVEHGAKGTILLLDNRRMAAISALQGAQYGQEFATDDGVEVDYVAMAKAFSGVQAFHGGYCRESLVQALDVARTHDGLSLVYVPVYYGDNPLGGLGAWGRWNVGNWVDATQDLRHKTGL